MKQITFNFKTHILCIVMAINMISAFADDLTLTETFSGIPANSISDPDAVTFGDYTTYKGLQSRSSATDFFTDNTPAVWIQTGTSAQGYVKSTGTIEGGIKDISFGYARFGSATNQRLKLVMYIDNVATDSVTATGNEWTDKEKHIKSISDLNIKKNFSLEFRNECYILSGSTLNGRFYLGAVTWTPYLYYTTRTAEMNTAHPYTNTGLIDNTGGEMTVTYTSSNPSIASVNASTGEVTGLAAGEVTITASAEDGAISTDYTLNVTLKAVPDATFNEAGIQKYLSDENFINTFNTNSNGTVTYTSSNENCAIVNSSTGEVTIVGTGETTIKASIEETSNFEAISSTYLLIVKPDGWQIETFDGAETDVDGNSYTYNTSPVSGTSTATGISWDVLLGSIRDDIGNFGSNAVVIRARKSSESDLDHAYLQSSSITGGINSLAFDWNCNGSETGRTWDISIFINNTEIGTITDEGTAQIPAGETFNRFSVSNIAIQNDFSIKIINNSDEAETSNSYRFVLDNLEWTPYSVLTNEEKISGAVTPQVSMNNGQIQIQTTGNNYTVNVYNISGISVLQSQNRQVIPATQLQPGIYLIEVALPDGTRSLHKVIR